MTSLLGRLLIIVVVALTPALAFQATTERSARHIREQLVQDEALRLLHLVVDEQRRIIDGAEQVLDAVSGAPEVQDSDPAPCQRLLQNVLAHSPRYVFIAVLGRDGRQVCAPGPLDTDLNASDRGYFRQALQTSGYAVGDYAIGRTSHEPTIQIAEPFRNRAGEIAGVVEVSLSLSWLAKQMNALDLPASAVAVVADHNGIVLARWPGGMQFVGTPQRADRAYLRQGDTVRVARIKNMVNGRGMIAAFSPPGADPRAMMVGVGLDEADTFDSVTKANQTGLALIGGGAGLAVVLTVVLGTTLIRRPVRQLVKSADRWRGGDLAARTGMQRNRGAFGRLAAAFDDMAETLQDRDRALHVALESTTDKVLVVDQAWRVTYINQRCLDLSLRNPAGEVLWDAFPTLLGTPFETGCRKAMQTGRPVTIETYFSRLQRYFEINAFPSPDGLTMFGRDVTEERRVAAALRESEDRLELARDAAGFGVWDCDLINNTLIWSEEQWRLHGLAPGLGNADMDTWITCLHPEDRARIIAAWQQAATDPERALNADYRVVWRDGSVHWLQSKAKAIRGCQGGVVRLVGLTLDVTAARETEAALRRLTADLETRVHQAVVEREAAQTRAALAERMHALGQLAGGIAHDINNVLQAVSGALTLIQRRTGDEASVRRFAQLGLDSVERGASVTRRLLSFGRQADMRMQTVDLYALLHGLQEILSYTLGAGIKVSVSLADDLPPLVTDKGQLETVLVNLATNARDAMPQGGTLTFTAARVVVKSADPAHPDDLAPGCYVRLAIGDTGLGMGPAVLARAREPFFTTKQPGAGTGLGLPMANGYVEQCGGRLTIDSYAGAGTTVTLWLPEKPGGTAELPRADTAAFYDPARTLTRVLLVDDEAPIREVLAKHLEEAGYAVRVAANGVEALALLEPLEAVDAVITDLSMPGMDGLAVIQAVQDRCGAIPAILLTGYAEDAGALAMAGPFNGRVSLLRKPVREIQLLDRLGAMLAMRPSLSS